MHHKYILAYKHIGETPLDVIHKLKATTPTLAEETISYAGRLDPMAEGLLLLLLGEENKKRNSYENLSKTYVIEILLGVSTDTYDLLGLLTQDKTPQPEEVASSVTTLRTFIGEQQMAYPPYSSKPVNGKPLYYWARNNLLTGITIPQKNIEIFSIAVLGKRAISGEELVMHAQKRITLVKGNFRQHEIHNSWTDFNKKHDKDMYGILQAEISCSSGTYMRTIANILGEKMGIPSLAFSIKRTKIGYFTVKDIYNLDDNHSVK